MGILGRQDGDPGRIPLSKGFQHLAASTPENRPIDNIGEISALSNRLGTENENPGEAGTSTGDKWAVNGITQTDYQLRAAHATSLGYAIAACHPEDAMVIMSAALADMQTGGPVASLFADCRAEAATWADCAPVHELEAYTLAGLARLGELPKGIVLRKRIFGGIWNSFSCEDQASFARRVGLIGGGK